MKNFKKEGNLTIYDNKENGLSWEFKYKDWDGKLKTIFEGISAEDMLDYEMPELIPYNFDKMFTEKEKELFVNEFNRIKQNAFRHDYYDSYDNSWKNYDD